MGDVGCRKKGNDGRHVGHVRSLAEVPTHRIAYVARHAHAKARKRAFPLADEDDARRLERTRDNIHAELQLVGRVRVDRDGRCQRPEPPDTPLGIVLERLGLGADASLGRIVAVDRILRGCCHADELA